MLLAPKAKSRFPLPLPLASTLSKSKNKAKWKQAATLNGQPYILGQVPTTSSTTLLGGKGKREREREFEGLLEQAASAPGMTLRIAADGTRTRGVGVGGRGGEIPVENLAGLGAHPLPAPPVSMLTTSTSSKQVGGGTGTSRSGILGPLYSSPDVAETEGDEAYPRTMNRAPTFPLSINSAAPRIEIDPDQSESTPTARKSRFRLGGLGMGGNNS